MNTKQNKKDALSWFELPATDYSRAKRFYEAVLQTSLDEVKVGEVAEALFPFDRSRDGVGGSIREAEISRRGQGGTLVYLNAEGDLDGMLSRVPAAGGAIVKPRTAIGPYGFIAVFTDSEGNVVGLHSRS